MANGVKSRKEESRLEKRRTLIEFHGKAMLKTIDY